MEKRSAAFSLMPGRSSDVHSYWPIVRTLGLGIFVGGAKIIGISIEIGTADHPFPSALLGRSMSTNPGSSGTYTSTGSDMKIGYYFACGRVYLTFTNLNLRVPGILC